MPRSSATEPSEDALTAWARLVRSSHSLLAGVEVDLKANGLPPLSWYDALLELRNADTGGLRPYQLQKQMLLAQYNLSRLVDRLASEGYVERIRCEEDGRGHVIRITKNGRELLKKMWPVYRSAVMTRFASPLGAGQIKQLAAILVKLV